MPCLPPGVVGEADEEAQTQDFFDPIRVKISTLPLLCFMFYHTMRFVCRQQKLKIQKQIVSPFWAWPLGLFHL